MLRATTLSAICLLIALFGQSQVLLTGQTASQKFEDATEVYINNGLGIPSYVKFQSPLVIGIDEFISALPGKLKLGEDIKFVKYREDADDMGMLHLRYSQYYRNIRMEGTMLIVHTRDGRIESFNGEFYPLTSLQTEIALDEKTCLEKVLNSKNRYAWEIPSEQKLLKEIKNDPNATWYPKGELVICAVNGELNNPVFKTAWKFDIYSLEPFERNNFYIDVQTGKQIHSQKLLCETDVNGKAITKYNGIRTILVDSLGTTSFRMRETGRGGGVDTYDNASLADFTDNNNIWDSTASKRQMVAGDVHYGSEMTFDYYKIFHNRKSFDNNNAKMIGILQGNYVNAFWNGTYAAFGMGSGSWGPVTGIDVVGHEYTHGVTQKSSNLVYSGEPGSLNESFSDIFGKLVENYGNQSKFTWYIGHYGAGSNKAFRNMANPNDFGCPDTYGGKFWNAGDIVHYNSSVQNFWFYLLSEGGSGKNDSNYTYYVDSIGMEKAGKVAYRNNAFYLTTSSKFNDARFYAIKAAEDIFGPCSRELEAVTNAWYAVGVGKGYTTPAGKPKGTTIEPFNPKYCSADSIISVNFKNPYNYTVIKYLWNFGDGDSSNLHSPTHVFKKYGIYKTILRTEFCYKYYYDTTTIILSQKPVVDFLINHEKQCLEKNQYQFTSMAYSKLKRKISLSWDSNPLFVSGKDSIVSFIFDTPSKYDIKLVVTDDRGCMNEITKQIEVIPTTTLDFSFKNACPDQVVTFNASGLPDTSHVAFTMLWDLAEGNTATDETTTKAFRNQGIYKISLYTLSANTSCTDTVSKWITIYKKPLSDFTYDSVCPGVETFFRKVKTNDSLTYFEWNFGIYRPNDKDSVKHMFPVPGEYSVSLKAAGKKCISTTTKLITVNPNPVALFTGHDVCEGEKQVLSNKSSVPKGKITEHEWDFADGTTSRLFEPEKAFTTFGNYLLKLSVTDQRGCRNSSTSNIKVNAIPLPSFNTADVCLGEDIQVLNTSADPEGNILNYRWWFDNTDKGQTRNLKLSNILTGTYNLKLEVRNDKGCDSALTKTVTVKPLPNPGFLFFGALYCVNENPNLQPVVPGGKWFMNNSPVDIVYSFPRVGSYTLKYVVEVQGCKDSSSQSTTVIDAPILDLGAEQRYCEQKDIALDAMQSNTSSWKWSTGETEPGIVVNKSGVYHVTLDHRCKTLTDTVAIHYFGDECPWFIPNAFSPNDDGINDVFEVRGRVFSEIDISVYNRLLQVVYKYKGPYKAWDGLMSNGDKIDLGTYPCQIILTGFNGELMEKNIALTVVR